MFGHNSFKLLLFAINFLYISELNKLSTTKLPLNGCLPEWYNGKERADELPRMGAATPLTGAEQFVGTQICSIKHKWEETKIIRVLEQHIGGGSSDPNYLCPYTLKQNQTIS